MNSYEGLSTILISNTTVATAPTGTSQRDGRNRPARSWLLGPIMAKAAPISIVRQPTIGPAGAYPATAAKTLPAACSDGARNNTAATVQKVKVRSQPRTFGGIGRRRSRQ